MTYLPEIPEGWFRSDQRDVHVLALPSSKTKENHT